MPLRISAVEVDVFPFNGPKLQLTADVVEVNVRRSLTADGSFGISLVPQTADWVRVIPVGSWIRIRMRTGPTFRMRTELWGRIDQTARTIQASGAGARRRIHVLNGRDHSGVFLDNQVYFTPYLLERADKFGFIAPPLPIFTRNFDDAFDAALRETFAGNPLGLMEFFLDIFLGRGASFRQTFELPESMKGEPELLDLEALEGAGDLIQFSPGPLADGLNRPGLKGVAFFEAILGVQDGGRLWDMMSQYSNAGLNELFCRMRQDTGLPELVFRERPFPCYTTLSRPDDHTLVTEQWERIEGIMIPETEFSRLNIGRNDYERANYFMLFPTTTPLFHQDLIFMLAGSYVNGAPVIDLQSIVRHGLRRLEVENYYLGYDNVQGQDRWTIPAGYWLSQIFSWYHLNDLYLSGTATVPFLARGDVGQRLWMKALDGTYTEFYIEGISKAWSKDAVGGAQGRTTFILTRGVADIHGTLERREHTDLVTWDVLNLYPLPDPPPEDAIVLLEAAATVEESWTDADELRNEVPNPDRDDGPELHRTPEVFTGFDTLFLHSPSAEEDPPYEDVESDAAPPSSELNAISLGFFLDMERLAYFEVDGEIALGPTEFEVGGGDEDVIFVNEDGDPIDRSGRRSAALVYDDTRIDEGDTGMLTIRTPKHIVLHSTNDTGSTFGRRGGFDAPEQLANLWANRWVEAAVEKTKVTHFMVSREGYIVQFLPINRTGAHAGRGIGDGNAGIGIDLEGAPGTHTEACLEAAGRLIRATELRALPLVPHRQITAGRHDPDEVDEELTGLPDWDSIPFNRQGAPLVTATPRTYADVVATGTLADWETQAQSIASLLQADPPASTGALASMVIDRTNSFVGSELVQAITRESAADELERFAQYRQLLEDNGITIATAEELTYLRQASAVQQLAAAGRPGWVYQTDTDRTLFALPPREWWYNIIPSLLILQAVFDDESLDLDFNDFEIYEAFRPTPYSIALNGVPGSRHTTNHAVDVRLKVAAFAADVDFAERDRAGERFWNALRHTPEDYDTQRYSAHIRLYPTRGDGLYRYRTHIDAGFYNGDTAPDGTIQDTSATHGREPGQLRVTTG